MWNAGNIFRKTQETRTFKGDTCEKKTNEPSESRRGSWLKGMMGFVESQGFTLEPPAGRLPSQDTRATNRTEDRDETQG